MKKHYNCRFHPTQGWHEVGCPHIVPNPMNDTHPFIHGEEGTHSVCTKHNIGGESVCCQCSGKTDCASENNSMKDIKEENRYTPYYELTEVVGGRIGLCICNDCGATILISKDEDSKGIHDKWHAALQTPTLEK